MLGAHERLSKVDGYFLRLMLWLWLFDMGLLLSLGLWPDTVMYVYGLGLFGMLLGALMGGGFLLLLATMVVPVGGVIWFIALQQDKVPSLSGGGESPTYWVRMLLFLTLLYNVTLYTGLIIMSGEDLFAASGLVWTVSLLIVLPLFFLWRRRLGTVTIPWRLMHLALLTVITVHVLLWFNVPLKLNFARITPQLEALIPDAPARQTYREPLNNITTPYPLTEYRVKSEGGTYFTLTHRYSALRGNGVIGFVYRPDISHKPPYDDLPKPPSRYEGSDSGEDAFVYHRLSADWYTFSMGVSFSYSS